MRPVNIASKTPSHGENRGSSPLGSANKINNLVHNQTRPVSVLGRFWGVSMAVR
jgi:hypothetical protein